MHVAGFWGAVFGCVWTPPPQNSSVSSYFVFGNMPCSFQLFNNCKMQLFPRGILSYVFRHIGGSLISISRGFPPIKMSVVTHLIVRSSWQMWQKCFWEVYFRLSLSKLWGCSFAYYSSLHHQHPARRSDCYWGHLGMWHCVVINWYTFVCQNQCRLPVYKVFLLIHKLDGA